MRISGLFLVIWILASATPAAEDVEPLDDADVIAILARGSAGVFYAWSPHLPLSVDGLDEIMTAGRRLGLTVIAVLSSHANVAYARDRIAGRNLPESVLRPGRAAELIERDLFVHAPAILIFDGGRFVSPVLPGLRHADDYEALIRRFLESAGK